MIQEEGALIQPGEIILSSEWVDQIADDQLLQLIRYFSDLTKDETLIDTHCGGIRNFDSVESFLEYKNGLKIETASKTRKKELTQQRRQEFQSRRPGLELALIERDGYVCAHLDCSQYLDLTIDHIVPLSKGGSDDLENLRLLCRMHNSQKGDRQYLSPPPVE